MKSKSSQKNNTKKSNKKSRKDFLEETNIDNEKYKEEIINQKLSKRKKNINEIISSKRYKPKENQEKLNEESIMLNNTKDSKEISQEKNNELMPLFKLNPKDIKNYSILLDNVSEDSNNFSQDVFLIFKSFITDIYYLVYDSKDNIIISYDLFNNKKLAEIKYNNNEKKDYRYIYIKSLKKDYISCFKYIYDSNNKRDLLMSINATSNGIRVWNFNTFSLLVEIKNINKSGYLNSACFINDGKNIYIATSNHRFTSKKVEPIKIFDLEGKKVKEINNSNENISYMSSYYDKKENKILILASFTKYIKAFDFRDNKTIYLFKDKYTPYNRNFIIHEHEKNTMLYEAASDGYIRIWDFNNAELIKRIKVDEHRDENEETGAFGICLWNNDVIFVGIHKKIVVINIKTEEIISILEYKFEPIHMDHFKDMISLKKIEHPKYGECLISKSYGESKIGIWTAKK